jgi:hypothetical protein
MKLKIFRTTLTSILLVITLSFILEMPTLAYQGRSESTKIEWGNLNTFSGRKISESFYLVDTGGQLGVEVFTSENHIIYAGFGYFYSLIPFTFTIDSQTSFDFASLKPNIPQTATTDLHVTSGAAHGYIVTIEQSHQLEKLDKPGTYIPDTSGDNSDVTYMDEGIWQLNSTPGFGYTLMNLNGTDATFTSGYRQFPDQSNLEQAQAVIENSGVTRGSSVRVEYKIIIDGAQDAGFYNTQIKYDCIGTF